MKKDSIILKKIGNSKIYINKSHKLPEYQKNFPFYDQALPRICQQLFNIDNFLNVVDVGANIGDSVSLISEKTRGNFLCIEGDKKYLSILKKNISLLKNANIEIEPSYCTESSKSDKNLSIENQDGTAKIIINDYSNTNIIDNLKTLDQIISEHQNFKKTNILKIDTDGFEINTIKGATFFLKSVKPVIFFEFTPALYQNLKQNPLEILLTLSKLGYESGLFYDNFGQPIDIIELKNKKRVNELIAKIDNENIYYYDILVYHKSKTHYKQLFIQELLSHNSLTSRYINKLNNDLINEKQKNTLIKEQLNLTQENLKSLSSQLESTVNKLQDIYNSRGWKILQHFYITRDVLLQKKNKIKKMFKENIFMNFKNKIINYQHRLSVKKDVNLNSKKIVYIGHSYHIKTKSTSFLLDFLKKHFEVIEILDYSWQGKSFPDLSFVDKSYLGVIFFQNIPDSETLNKIDNDNLIFFPMYDNVGGKDYDFWKKYINLKIVNFSKTLHQKLINWGFDSIYIQYFPKPLPYIKNKNHKVFFWQRTNTIDINLVEKLLSKVKTKIHIHQAIDPNCTFIKPTKIQENKFNISYSNWFETREEMQQKIQECDIYIAPREYEGIGMSFLEAMSMGKAVISINNPTMNEYIIDNKNGYLFNINKTKPINFFNLEKVRKNTHEYIQTGYKKWISDRTEIIKFIKKP